MDEVTQVWWVYVLGCSDGTFYAGITTDLERRVHEHNATQRGARYTRSRRPVSLEAFWSCSSRSEALKWEHAFKSLSRNQKMAWIKRLEEDSPQINTL